MERLWQVLNFIARAIAEAPSEEDALALYRSLEFRRETSESLRKQLSFDDEAA